ncbi:uncharacterized protein MELLADRAFT_87023 [Melampsora larici-populina 98AG31]|uniref:SMODS and SLOG-associating 2TM effector domain-containing protein n=1 Tax=Melampsora larici-populina (strain 98AG31 / pathotype 3-4-7) TaxID=747676 RepID=F4R487_MELLP|nr:uncharacterized protein MELLADRAFT_87023 [Melampsora larici-populina 98AG31]EGG12764.1 hypothetical protein MELLADRAFT_87023 [Melampsora larici-populina 98AG31]
MAHSVHSASASLVLGTTTTIAGTIITGLRATGQPKRAHDRCKRLDKIIDHITRLYYEFGQNGPTHPGLNGSGAVDENGVIERAIEATWKMIDDEEAQAELEERKFVPFGYSTGGMIPSPVDIGGSEVSRGLGGNKFTIGKKLHLVQIFRKDAMCFDRPFHFAMFVHHPTISPEPMRTVLCYFFENVFWVVILVIIRVKGVSEYAAASSYGYGL